MPKPTPVQRKILEAIRDGAELSRTYSMTVGERITVSKPGYCQKVAASTLATLKQNDWVQQEAERAEKVGVAQTKRKYLLTVRGRWMADSR